MPVHDNHIDIVCRHNSNQLISYYRQGILLGLCYSCGADKNATALCYITESHKLDKLKNSMVTFYNKRLSSGQTTKWSGFGRIRCSRQTATETCEVDFYMYLGGSYIEESSSLLI